MLLGERVTLRAYEKEDLERARSFFNVLEIRENMVLEIIFPLKAEDEQKWYDGFSANTDKEYSFAITLNETGEYIGGCGVHNISGKNRNCMVGIFLGHDFLDQGYGSEALKILVAFCFNEINVIKVKLNVMSFNARAQRAYEKIGFSVEAIHKKEVYRRGEYHDSIRMVMFKEDFLKTL